MPNIQKETYSGLYIYISFLVLSLFTVVQWGQGLCQAVSGEYGTCITNGDCALKGGTSGGPCAEGYGICCICKCNMHNIFLKLT